MRKHLLIADANLWQGAPVIVGGLPVADAPFWTVLPAISRHAGGRLSYGRAAWMVPDGWHGCRQISAVTVA